MATVTLSGSSDDLIEVDGDIREEFSYRAAVDDGDLVAFSDGTVLRIRLGEVWRITVVARGVAEVAIEQTSESSDAGYTDVATLVGDIRWAVHGTGFARARGVSS